MADLVLVDGDPLLGPRRLAAPVAVIQAGRRVRYGGQRLSRFGTSGSGPRQRSISSVAKRP